MKFELKPNNRNVSDKELLEDLKRIAQSLQTDSIGKRDYDEHGGRFNSATIYRRFKGWNNALEKAGLIVTKFANLSKKELFENMEEVWVKLGRQPNFRDMKRPISKYTTGPYTGKFGTWIKALGAFVEYMNTNIEEIQYVEEAKEPIQEKEIVFKHRTKREPSARLKVQVLIRDGNKCRLCGITVTGDNIHFDHIKPWSKGGETTLDNLQVLCAEHNLAKGNLL